MSDMSGDGTSDDGPKLPGSGKYGTAARAALAAGGSIPFAGALLAAIGAAWSEKEQGTINEFLRAWVKMLEDELREKQETIIGIIARLDVHDEEISERMKSVEYQSLLKLAFRNWSGTESKEKREYIRNILSNAAATRMASDDVVRLFIEWIGKYSDLHFLVIREIYQSPSSTRGEIWSRIGRGEVAENSADADLFKLLCRDLSTGGVIRQHRETDGAGRFIKQVTSHRGQRASSDRVMKSAFDDKEEYELTELGKQFVHYAMTDLPMKIEFKGSEVPKDRTP